MFAIARRTVKKIAKSFGYEIQPIRQYGTYPMADMQRLLHLAGRTSEVVIFDIGANVGSTVRDFSKAFASPIIHAFEPSPGTFEFLKANTSDISRLTLNNSGIGSSNGRQVFHESQESTMSSFLKPDRDCWVKPSGDATVRVETIDCYCERNGIKKIDILKSDTQGYEMEVLRGAERMFKNGGIGLVYLEIIFSAMYEGLPGMDEIFRFLIKNGFHLVTFYRTETWDNRASWIDALFAFSDTGKEIAIEKQK
jgi:FkbM family methyltransferase